MASRRGCLFCAFVLLFFSLVQLSVCLLRELTTDDIVIAIEKSCVVAVTDNASSDVYNTIQYLSDVAFAEEPAVVVAFVHLDELTNYRGREIIWDESSRDVDKDLVFLKRKTVQRNCLMPVPRDWFSLKAEVIRGARDVETLLSFMNNMCSVYRSIDGGLTLAGQHRNHILNDLFHVNNVTNTNMGMIYKLPRLTDARWSKGGHSGCTVNSSFFTAPNWEQCIWDYNTERKSVSYGKGAMHAAHITQCETIDMPTYEEFKQKYLFRSKPVIIKNVAQEWPAFRKWTNQFLRDKFGDVVVHIKLSPTGDYEGVESAELWEDFHTFNIPQEVKSKLEFPELVVVRPATLNIKFSEFLDMVEKVSHATLTNISVYLEYTSIKEYFEEIVTDVNEMPFISDKLKLSHQNIWLSDGNTLGKLHFDPFDNFLCQVSGKKEVILFDPHNNDNLYEAHIPEAVLGFNKNTSTFRRKTFLDSTSMVMSPADILKPDFEKFPQLAQAYPMNCTIGEGDVLYMPAFWWHEVQSHPNKTAGRNMAVNFWYEPFLTKEFPCPECKLDVNTFYRDLL